MKSVFCAIAVLAFGSFAGAAKLPFGTTDGTDIPGLYDCKTKKCFINVGGGSLTLGENADADGTPVTRVCRLPAIPPKRRRTWRRTPC